MVHYTGQCGYDTPQRSHTVHYYRPPTKFAKVMFLYVSVILSGRGLQAHTQGEVGGLARGVSRPRPGGPGGGCIPACTEADTLQQTAGAADGTHPTGMHSSIQVQSDFVCNCSFTLSDRSCFIVDNFEHVWMGLIHDPVRSKLNSFEHLWRVGSCTMGGVPPCMVRPKSSWVMVTWEPPQDSMTDTLTQVKTLPSFLQLCWRAVMRYVFCIPAMV